MTQSDRAPVSWYSSKYFIVAILCAATVLAYQPVVNCKFVNLDDETYVLENPHVQTGLTAENVRWAMTATLSANWHPLTWLTLQLDAVLHGRFPAGYHFTNLLIHTLTTALLFLVLHWMTGAMWRSALVAALFGIHPLHVESVAWVFERKDVLCALFWVLTLIAYVCYVERRTFRRYLLVLLSFALGIASKPMIVTLPFVLLLLDYWPLGIWFRGLASDIRGQEKETRRQRTADSGQTAACTDHSSLGTQHSPLATSPPHHLISQALPWGLTALGSPVT
jgi:hypothetical protein